MQAPELGVASDQLARGRARRTRECAREPEALAVRRLHERHAGLALREDTPQIANRARDRRRPDGHVGPDAGPELVLRDHAIRVREERAPSVDPDELLFDHEQQLTSGEEVGPGDVDRLEDRGVGFPSECEDPPGDWERGDLQIRPEDRIPRSQRPD